MLPHWPFSLVKLTVLLLLIACSTAQLNHGNSSSNATIPENSNFPSSSSSNHSSESSSPSPSLKISNATSPILPSQSNNSASAMTPSSSSLKANSTENLTQSSNTTSASNATLFSRNSTSNPQSRPSVVLLTRKGPNIDVRETERGCYVLPDLNQRTGKLSLKGKFDEIKVDLRSPFVVLSGDRCANGQEMIQNLIRNEPRVKGPITFKVREICKAHKKFLGLGAFGSCKITILKTAFTSFEGIEGSPWLSPGNSTLGTICQYFSLCNIGSGKSKFMRFQGIMRLNNVVESASKFTVVWDIFNPQRLQLPDANDISVQIKGVILDSSQNAKLADLDVAKSKYPAAFSVSLATSKKHYSHWKAGNYVHIVFIIYKEGKAVGYSNVVNQILADGASPAVGSVAGGNANVLQMNPVAVMNTPQDQLKVQPESPLETPNPVAAIPQAQLPTPQPIPPPTQKVLVFNQSTTTVPIVPILQTISHSSSIEVATILPVPTVIVENGVEKISFVSVTHTPIPFATPNPNTSVDNIVDTNTNGTSNEPPLVGGFVPVDEQNPNGGNNGIGFGEFYDSNNGDEDTSGSDPMNNPWSSFELFIAICIINAIRMIF
ncbi:hypothetical protein BKA69DRAFT_1037128 [Paraphysoderma sedebokerense]|nr:hypothetical protein BKA69DRAFT_1037128 [Paraphysoderma sedebokerense]